MRGGSQALSRAWRQTLARQQASVSLTAPQKIPRQRLPRWCRRALQWIVLPYLALDRLSQSLVRLAFPPRYRIEGFCKKRGACCRYIVVAAPRRGTLARWFYPFADSWAREVNGFFPLDFELDDLARPAATAASDNQQPPARDQPTEANPITGNTLELDIAEPREVGHRIYGCRHLQEDGRCADYFFRPSVCRDWPRRDFFRAPHVLKGCGFQAVLRQGAVSKKDRHGKLPIVDER